VQSRNVVEHLSPAVLAMPIATANGKRGSAFSDSQKERTAFDDVNDRVQAILTEFKALPGGATDQKKDAIRKRFCAVAGELVGFYKFVQALGNDCVKQGDNMTELMGVVNKQLELAQQGVKTACEQ